MPHVDKHAPGDFCWLELATSDQAAAKNFYASLYGWVANDMPMGPDNYYTIFRLDGRDTSAAYTLTAEETSRHIPPHWNLYVAVENADAAAAKATELGGKVLAPAFDVLDAGRMAIIQDPTGAIFIVWQAKKNIGIGVTNRSRDVLLGRLTHARSGARQAVLFRLVRLGDYGRREGPVGLPAH